MLNKALFAIYLILNDKAEKYKMKKLSNTNENKMY